MLFFFKFFFIFLISKSLQSNQDYYLNAFKETLLEFNITFDNLGNHKAGAICIPTDSHSHDKYAVGFSYDMFEKSYAVEISLSGCKEMKKKLISYDCKCEIIYEQ